MNRLTSARTPAGRTTAGRARADGGTPARALAGRTRLAAAGGALLLVAAAGSAAAADKAPLDAPRKAAGGGVAEPRLTGTAKLHRTAGDVIHFSFDAHGGGIDTRGTFRFSHYVEGEGSYAQGRMDCLVSGGPVTVATGVVTKSDLPGLKGKRVGFSVTNDGQRLGYSWAATSDPRSAKDLPQCVSSAPYERVERGGFDVVPFEPEL